jgi:hypothetical protein
MASRQSSQEYERLQSQEDDEDAPNLDSIVSLFGTELEGASRQCVTHACFHMWPRGTVEWLITFFYISSIALFVARFNQRFKPHDSISCETGVPEHVNLDEVYINYHDLAFYIPSLAQMAVNMAVFFGAAWKIHRTESKVSPVDSKQLALTTLPLFVLIVTHFVTSAESAWYFCQAAIDVGGYGFMILVWGVRWKRMPKLRTPTPHHSNTGSAAEQAPVPAKTRAKAPLSASLIREHRKIFRRFAAGFHFVYFCVVIVANFTYESSATLDTAGGSRYFASLVEDILAFEMLTLVGYYIWFDVMDDSIKHHRSFDGYMLSAPASTYPENVDELGPHASYHASDRAESSLQSSRRGVVHGDSIARDSSDTSAPLLGEQEPQWLTEAAYTHGGRQETRKLASDHKPREAARFYGGTETNSDLQRVSETDTVSDRCALVEATISHAAGLERSYSHYQQRVSKQHWSINLTYGFLVFFYLTDIASYRVRYGIELVLEHKATHNHSHVWCSQGEVMFAQISPFEDQVYLILSIVQLTINTVCLGVTLMAIYLLVKELRKQQRQDLLSHATIGHITVHPQYMPLSLSTLCLLGVVTLWIIHSVAHGNIYFLKMGIELTAYALIFLVWGVLPTCKLNKNEAFVNNWILMTLAFLHSVFFLMVLIYHFVHETTTTFQEAGMPYIIALLENIALFEVLHMIIHRLDDAWEEYNLLRKQ